MKKSFRTKRAITLSSIILGLGLSAITGNIFANAHEENGMNAPAVIPQMPTAPQSPGSGVTSAAPPMSQINFNGVSSLRGNVSVGGANDASTIKLQPADRLPIARNYFQQPPLIPHRVREYKITVRNNKCMSCHSWKNYKQARATKVSQTHFTDRDGNAQSKLAARRYFCNQCHVPQVDAKPLVENSFTPVNELNK